ncbi:hypothetical protein F7734_19120 [Scytonema sp. UIC 10036]|uniref:hypothetical protein n=1 Tax=Scytonema sp. UIC 10036 TaxID=2304196 RepID=UPI0012DA19F1|nr:hypothetical protein [Scytonema sp. UIC 10036]MUG94371.1 hypothetical protein [Scytonema sp. UIC 10036]
MASKVKYLGKFITQYSSLKQLFRTDVTDELSVATFCIIASCIAIAQAIALCESSLQLMGAPNMTRYNSASPPYAELEIAAWDCLRN